MKFSSVIPSLVVTAMLSLAVVPQLDAQVPKARKGQFEIHGFDFRPDGAWRKKVSGIRQRRNRLIGEGNMALLNASPAGSSATVLTGNLGIPVVPIRYSNTNAGALRPVAEYQDRLFAAAPAGFAYSLASYYGQLSNGLLSISGTVLPWVPVSNNDTYYEDGCNGIGATPGGCAHPNSYGVSARFAEMVLEVLSKVSTGADSASIWAVYDNDGPDGLPNSGDDDGYVDFVAFLQPELDGACGPLDGPNRNDNIWAHRWVVDGLNGGSPFITKTPSAEGGYIKVSDYTIQSAVGGPGACGPESEIMPIGTLAHETGHTFGLPDLYDTSQQSEGIGEFGLMGSGNYARPYSPSRMEGWSMVELGWVKVDTLKSTGTVTMNPVATSDTVRLLPTQVPGEYFILENRAAVESDTAQMNPALNRPKSPGLYVWHIDQSRINSGSFSNSINTGAIQGVALVQADGLNNLRSVGDLSNRGDAGDAYPGVTNNTVLDGYTNPGLTTNAAKLVPGRIDSIRIVGNTVLFRFRVEHLLQVTKFGTGTGTVTASVPGNTSDGVGVTPGTEVTVTAVPTAGHQFAGWTGDTVTTEPVLVITVDRNWSLAAQFTFTAPFTTVSAANDLLGVPSLSNAQKSLLDQDGNHNGTYDLGDFLAWVTVSGQGVPPELMARLLAAAAEPAPAASKGVTP